MQEASTHFFNGQYCVLLICSIFCQAIFNRVITGRSMISCLLSFSCFFHVSVCFAWGCFFFFVLFFHVFFFVLFFQYTLSGHFSTLIRCYFHWESTNQPKKLQAFQDRKKVCQQIVNKWASASRMVFIKPFF